ncbi:MAG: hypothetical protein JWL85_670 [Candidatus Saccharibacteria bacterium]|nr:hypothetical protein [Candidatus Saccharibacteria bacterium]
MGLQPRWLVENGLFAVATPHGERYVNYARSSLNSHVNASLAKNKFHTRLILERHGLPNIPYAHPTTLAEAESFLRAHGTIIVKPVEGQGSQDIHIVTSISQLTGMNITKCIFEKYITGREMRYLVLNDRVIAVHQSEYGSSVAADRDLERISFSEASWEPHLAELSLAVTDIFRLKFAAIDFLVDDAGHAYILEINSAPGLKWFHAPTTGPGVDVASLFMEALVVDSKN